MNIMSTYMNVEGFPNALARTIKQPLDTSEVWESLKEAEAYVANGTSYKGQIISVQENNVYVPYIVQDGELKGLLNVLTIDTDDLKFDVDTVVTS